MIIITDENGNKITEDLLTPIEVATIFRVDPKTVAKWTKSGKLPVACRTIGGHKRYSKKVILDLLNRKTD